MVLFYNPPPSVRKQVESPSFRVLADTLNSIERYGDYKYTKTQRHRHPLLRRLKHLKYLIPPFDTWKGQLESVATSYVIARISPQMARFMVFTAAGVLRGAFISLTLEFIVTSATCLSVLSPIFQRTDCNPMVVSYGVMCERV